MAYRQEGLNAFRQLKIVQFLVSELWHASSSELAFVGGHRVYEGVEVEGWQVWVLSLDEHDHGVVVDAEPHLAWTVVVKVGECYLQVYCQF